MKNLPLILAIFCVFLVSPAMAQDEANEAAAETAQEVAEDSTYDERLELAKKMHELRPVRAQVENAIKQYAMSRPEGERETFKTAMRNVFNVTALEKISTDAYADTFSVEELRAMVEYYSKPEAISAGEKMQNYANTVYPEIMRMLDRAAMRVKTGK